MDLFNYSRRETSEVNIGATPMGGSNPIRIQSMTNTATQDTEASVAQAKRIVDAGGEYVRLTAQGIKEAENLMNINIGLRQDGYMVPLVADIHFNPKVADVAAQYVEKVRINPGNYVDAARTFKHLEYTDEEYAQELQKIHDRFVPFLNICKENHTAIRIGVNHGSLSDRIMSRYGDTPEGMVESCMEFLRICVQENFTDVVISIKASNTVVMVKTVRLLAAVMEQESMRFPLHLGVTEAGDGEDGRIKSALGIGALLADGLGDTIRVSLSEAPEAEIPVARKLVDYIVQRTTILISPEQMCRNSIISLPPAARLPPYTISAETICPWSLPHAWTGTWTSIRNSCRTISIRDVPSPNNFRKACNVSSMPMSGWSTVTAERNRTMPGLPLKETSFLS